MDSKYTSFSLALRTVCVQLRPHCTPQMSASPSWTMQDVFIKLFFVMSCLLEALVLADYARKICTVEQLLVQRSTWITDSVLLEAHSCSYAP